ncbi:4Fe-4S binding protein [Chloroflexota bacterium]
MPAKALVTIRRLVGQDHEFDISFSTECDHCGICVKYCFYGALKRERKSKSRWN